MTYSAHPALKQGLLEVPRSQLSQEADACEKS